MVSNIVSNEPYFLWNICNLNDSKGGFLTPLPSKYLSNIYKYTLKYNLVLDIDQKTELLLYKTESFPVIIDKNSTFSLSKISNYLKKGGILISFKIFNKDNYTFKSYLEKLKIMGYEIIDNYNFLNVVKFKSIGEMLYILGSPPWNLHHIKLMQRELEFEKIKKYLFSYGEISINNNYYSIIAKKIKK